MPIIKSQFSPSWLLKNTHAQTVLASKIFKPVRFETNRERIEMPDGDFVDIEQPTVRSQHVVALFHGLAGCVESPYIQGALATLTARGFHPILMHWRGSSGEPNRLTRAYHSGASDDIQWFIDYLAARFAGANLYAIGYSLGGNALLKYLGEQGTASPLTGAMSVSPPLVLAEGATKLNTGVARIYQRYLL
ncbi:MAG: putative alpha/beta-fold hydrolase, partial [Granulosicoccus sp.]